MMLLENKYYRLTEYQTDDRQATFHISLLPDCEVYRGHFPGKPVCPGVCNIEMVKECAMLFLKKKLRIQTISKCRFTTVAIPTQCKELTLTLSVIPQGSEYGIEAQICDTNQTYMEYKGKMQVI